MSNTNRRFVIAGNWKMFKTANEAEQFVKELAEKIGSPSENAPEVIICPPTIALDRVQQAVKTAGLTDRVAVSAQTMESRDEGAYTGETSPTMLLHLSIQTVVIGHSERRQYYNETDITVNEKVKAALAHNITPIVCVGESLEQREAGKTDSVIATQVKAALKDLVESDYNKLVFAYEPIWAIGTGKVCESAEANRVCGVIRTLLGVPGKDTRILYGGSVKPSNSEELLATSDIDGALIGGASLDASSFATIITHATEIAQPVTV